MAISLAEREIEEQEKKKFVKTYDDKGFRAAASLTD
jgi:hypothetical protein